MAPQKALSPSRMLTLSVALLTATLVMYLAAAIAQFLRNEHNWPDWSFVTRIVGLLWIAYSVFVLVSTARQFRTEEAAARIQQSGGDPRQIRFIIGSASVLTPALVGVALAATGASAYETYSFCAVSTIAFLAWWWHNRGLFWERLAVDAAFQYSKIYTAMLLLVGTLSVIWALFGMRIDHVVSPQWTLIKAILLFVRLWFFVLGLACWIVTVMRFRRSALAVPATDAVSWLIPAFVPLGTLTWVYWLLRVRSRERSCAEATAT